MTPEVLEIALSMMEALDSARSLSVAIQLRYGEFRAVAEMSTDPAHYTDPTEYFVAVCATDFLRKFDGMQTGIDLEDVTLRKWWWGENQCFHTNRRLNHLVDSGFMPDDGVSIESFVSRARKKVIQLIGQGPPAAFDGAFGPGATVSDVSTHTTVCDKMSSTPTLTSNALFYLVPWVGTEWGKASAALERKPSVVRGNEYFTVPKDSRTHRACGKEPSLNVFYQLGLGRVMRERLRSSGIDLELGQSTHRRVACAASQSGDFATIDLSSASDTIASNLVKLLLPTRWFQALNDLRSPATKVGDRWVVLEKFSSMGNGFTFELETCIFCALILALDDSLRPGVNVWVYGDDIIVPSTASAAVVSTLKFFGFTPNEKKTFTEGPFRESCGGDFFLGEPVRAHFLKEEPREPQDYISLANGIRRLLKATCLHDHHRKRLLRVWFGVLDRIPTNIRRCRGPEWLGDLVIHDDETRWETRWRGQLRYVRCYRPARHREVSWDGFGPGIQFAALLYGVFLHRHKGRNRWKGALAQLGLQAEADDRCFHPRDSVVGYKVGWTNCP